MSADAPETVIRRLVGSYWLTAWMGAELDQKLFGPGRALGFSGREVSFSPEKAADVAPYSPTEVKASAGFTLLRFREVDRFSDEITSGVTVAGDVVTGEYVLHALDFEFAVPSKPKDGADAVEVTEARTWEVEKLFRGLTIRPTDQPVLSIRNLARYPTLRRGGSDDGTWRRSYLTVQMLSRVRTINQGAKEVALP